MRFSKSVNTRNFLVLFATVTACFPAPSQYPIFQSSHEVSVLGNRNVSIKLFIELEEFARLVDIAYCVGVTGIQAPFECASRCDEFPGYELVDTWNTGPLMSDSCGYIALDHVGKRVIVAFRGTYSITNTIYDLATVPQEYIPYPGDPDDDPERLLDLEEQTKILGLVPSLYGPDDGPEKSPDPEKSSGSHGILSRSWRWFGKAKSRFAPWSSGIDGLSCTERRKPPITMHGKGERMRPGARCDNCTVHMGFFSSWKDCRRIIMPHLRKLSESYPGYSLNLVGHSLGGAVAALAALETELLGWQPTVTTFGEPRIGNAGLSKYLNKLFELDDIDNKDEHGSRFRRMTHHNDPVPLLPLTEWGYKMHSGEIYISKPELQPSVSDLRLCKGDEDVKCIFSGEAEAPLVGTPEPEPDDGSNTKELRELELEINNRWGFPARYRLWQLFFAHRDYFWRLGLCVKGGDPADWGRRYDNITDGEE